MSDNKAKVYGDPDEPGMVVINDIRYRIEDAVKGGLIDGTGKATAAADQVGHPMRSKARAQAAQAAQAAAGLAAAAAAAKAAADAAAAQAALDGGDQSNAGGDDKVRDPGDHGIEKVNAYLEAHPEERDRVLELERNGKKRKGILEPKDKSVTPANKSATPENKGAGTLTTGTAKPNTGDAATS